MRTCVHNFFDHQDQVGGVKYNGIGSKLCLLATTRKSMCTIAHCEPPSLRPGSTQEARLHRDIPFLFRLTDMQRL